MEKRFPKVYILVGCLSAGVPDMLRLDQRLGESTHGEEEIRPLPVEDDHDGFVKDNVDEYGVTLPIDSIVQGARNTEHRRRGGFHPNFSASAQSPALVMPVASPESWQRKHRPQGSVIRAAADAPSAKGYLAAAI